MGEPSNGPVVPPAASTLGSGANGSPRCIGVAAVIPTLNEVCTIGHLVGRCLTQVEVVYVLDGGSRDGTDAVASAHGAKVIACGQRGLGRAIRAAIESDLAEVLVFLDGDGSHRPEDIPQLLAPIMQGDADLVIADRITGGSEELDGDLGHLPRRLGTRILQALVNWRLGSRLNDIQNGFRAIRSDVAIRLDLHEDGFCICQEMAVGCLRKGYRVANVPSFEERRTHGHSRLRLWAEWPRFVWTMACWLWSGAAAQRS